MDGGRPCAVKPVSVVARLIAGLGARLRPQAYYVTMAKRADLAFELPPLHSICANRA